MNYRVTYGIVSSAYKAIKAPHQLASDEVDKFPRAVKLIYNMYVDDALFGADNVGCDIISS